MIRNPIPAIPGEELVVTVDHLGRGGIEVAVDHPMCEKGAGFSMNLESARDLRDALDTLLYEQQRNSHYIAMAG